MPTILIVDDEPTIRQLVTRVFVRKGYKVIACENAEDAMAVNEPIDLLVVDLVLPEINGRDLAEKLRMRTPGLPVVLMSGFLSQRELMPPPPSVFLQKPMMPAAVVEAAEKLLAGH